jgi:uncharacterized membrane protein
MSKTSKRYSFLVSIFWCAILVLSAYYLYRAINFRFYKEGIGDTFWDKQFFYVFHLIAALAPLVLGPFQFWSWFRNNHIRWHRLMGKIYIAGSLLGAITAFILGITIEFDGSIVPLIFLSVLWFFMTLSAWLAIRRGNTEVHRLFMIRSYTLAMTFITIRILADLVYNHNLFFFIENDEIKDTTYEWLSWVLPLLILEFCISWWPAINRGRNTRVLRT